VIRVEVVKAPWWSKQEYYLRRRRDPDQVTRGELMARIAFAEATQLAFGGEGLGPNGLPLAAESVKAEMEGKRIVEMRTRDLSRQLLLRALRAVPVVSTDRIPP